MHEFAPQISGTIDHIVQSISYFRPELILSIGFVVNIFASLFVDRYWRDASLITFLATVLLSGVFVSLQPAVDQQVFFEMIRLDTFSQSARMIILVGVITVGIFIRHYAGIHRAQKHIGDVFTVLIATTLGMHLLTLTTHWILAFIAIEMVSIGSYILVGYFADKKSEAEAAMKYVLFGSACSAFMLYGLSLIYGFTGSLDFTSMAQLKGLIAAPIVLSTIALLFVFVGIGFKLGFVPFHMWTPDVYEGAPTPVTAFLSTVPKVAAIVLFGRLLLAWTANPFYFGEVTGHFLCFVAIVTMLIGNLIALRQQNVKRLLAYSSIGHTGFLLLAVLTYVHREPEVLLFYVAAYTFMNLAAFGFVMILEQHTQSTQLADYAGLGKRFPLLFASFSFVGISLVGLPPTAGFVGKLLVFTSVFDLYQTLDQSRYLYLLIVGVLTSVISLFYYLKIPLYSFLRLPAENQLTMSLHKVPKSSPVFVLAVLFTLLLGVFGLFPSWLLDLFRAG